MLPRVSELVMVLIGNTFLVQITTVQANNNESELALKEHHIFGSSRLGLEAKNLIVYTSSNTSTTIDPVPTNFLSLIGDKRFELSNHLGNVLAVVSDKKIPTATAGVFNPDVLSYSDYYPFGSLVPNRHADSNTYRYGFNGKELDNELKEEGNSYDFGARMYDPRIGRWFSTDPKEDKFPNMSPYVAFNNNPILYDDPTGESGEITINKKTKTVTVTSIYVFYGSQSSPKLAKQYAKRIQDDYNKANGKVKIGGKMYSVKFRVVGVDISKFGEVAAYNLIDRNKDIRKNFIRVEKETNNPRGGVSFTDAGGNTGYWSTDQVNENKLTTVSHEHNHSLDGLDHPEDVDRNGGNGDQEPSIDMSVESYNYVKKEFRQKVLKKEDLPYVDVTKRKVTQKNIDAYFTDEVKKDLEEKGKANLGHLTNEYHTE